MRTARFSSKAKTLEQLSNLSISANIPKSLYFKVKEWVENPSFWIKHIRDNFYFDKYIVRSSSQAEDQQCCSNAGAFLSMPDVSPEDLEAVRRRIRWVPRGSEPHRPILKALRAEERRLRKRWLAGCSAVSKRPVREVKSLECDGCQSKDRRS